MTATVDAVALRLRRLGKLSPASPRIRAALERAADEARAKSKATAPKRDGYLRASIFGRVEGPDVLIGSTERYADVHERGGTIRPVRARYLTIPLLGQRGWARHDPTPMFVFRARSGKLYLAERIGRRIRPRWWLRDQTVAPARRFLEAGSKVAIRRMRTLIPLAYTAEMEG